MGKRVLIDTDCLIDYYKDKLELASEDSYYISEISLYEFVRGTKNVKESKELLERSFQIVWLDNEILEKASEIWRSLKLTGVILDDRDLIIGATAITKNLKLLTRNVKHYEKLREYNLSFL
jgi:predicted nucleic acid-binding protein